MVNYKEKLDDIFTAFYGSDTDENGEKYKDIYHYEAKGMAKDFENYVDLMQGMPFNLSADDLVKFIIWTEYNHIGYTRHNKMVDYMKLKKVVLELVEF